MESSWIEACKIVPASSLKDCPDCTVGYTYTHRKEAKSCESGFHASPTFVDCKIFIEPAKNCRYLKVRMQSPIWDIIHSKYELILRVPLSFFVHKKLSKHTQASPIGCLQYGHFTADLGWQAFQLIMHCLHMQCGSALKLQRWWSPRLKCSLQIKHVNSPTDIFNSARRNGELGEVNHHSAHVRISTWHFSDARSIARFEYFFTLVLAGALGEANHYSAHARISMRQSAYVWSIVMQV